MLDEWDEDNKLAPLESVVERASSTSTFFAYNTFASRLGGAASKMVHRYEKDEPTLQFRGDELISESELN